MGQFRFLTLAVILLAAICPGMAADSAGAAPVRQGEMARVRFVNASFDAPALDAYVDGQLWVGGIRDFTNYQSVPAGDHSFTFRLRGTDDALASIIATVEADQRVTVAAVYPMETMDIRVIVDDVSAPARNAARVKVVNAAPNAGPLTVTAGEVTLADGLKFKETSDAQQLFDDRYMVFAKDEDGLPVMGGEMVTITGYRTYTLFIVGAVESDEHKLVTAESTVLKPKPTSWFHFSNMAQGVESLTAYVNNESVPLFPNVRFSQVTEHYVTGPGPFRLDVYPVGSGPDDSEPLASGAAEIGEHETVLFIALGTVDDLEIVAYTSDLSPLPVNTSRLHVIHAATGNPAIRVATLNDILLFDEIAPGRDASRTVPAGNYNLRFSDPDADETMMEKSGFWLAPGTETTIIAFDNDPLTPLVNAIAISTDNIPPVVPVRWAHLNSAAPPVDLYLDEQLIEKAMQYQDSTDYAPVEPGRYTLAVYPAGANPSINLPLQSATLDLRWVDAPRTIYLFGSAADDVRFETAPENATLLPEGKARIRFINAVIGTTSVDVARPVTGARVVEGLGFSAASVNLNLDAGETGYVFLYGGEPIATLHSLDVKAGVSYTIVLVGELPDAETLVLVYTPWR
jgi:hypothetical protein